jgi:cyanophycinase
MRSPSPAPRPPEARSTPAARALRALVPAVGLAASLALAAPAGAAPVRTAVPIGAGYDEQTLERFATAAARHDTNGEVRMVVLDITYGLDPYTAKPGARQKNTTLADGRRGQIEDACDVVASPKQTCNAILDDVQLRSEAFEPAAVAPFGPTVAAADVDGMYVLGGDQDVGMLVVANTPLEQAMATAYANGAVISGNSAGAAVESTNMIAGYTGNNGPENGFEKDSVLLWLNDGPNDGERGLSFGLPGVLLDQHVAQRGRIARLVNASYTTGLLGIGVDASTAAAIENETSLTDVSGATVSFVADPLTYGAHGTFGGPRNSLAIHGVATQVLAPGDAYDIASRLPSTGGTSQRAPSIAGRTFGSAFDRPTGAGPLLLGGGLTGDRGGLVASRFVGLAGGSTAGARIVVLAAGYARSTDAAAEAKAEATALQGLSGAPVARFVIDSKTDVAAVTAAIGGASGIWLTSPDQSLVMAAQPDVLAAVRNRWASGAALLLDDGAAAAAATWMTTNPTPPSDTAGLETASSAAFLVDNVTISHGLGLVPNVAVEPRLLPDRHWGRLYDLLRHDQSRLGIGIDVGTALELGGSGPRAIGDSTVVALDGRQGTVGAGTNGAVSAHWVLLDSYVNGNPVAP